MNNICITHELCAEDRARIDRLIAALERKSCDACVSGALNWAEAIQRKEATDTPKEQGPIQRDPVEAPKNATETAGEIPPPLDQTQEETPVGENDAQQEDPQAPTVTLAQIQQKVVELCAAQGGAKKAEVRAAVNAYAKKVSDLPEDKWAEVWAKLEAIDAKA